MEDPTEEPPTEDQPSGAFKGLIIVDMIFYSLVLSFASYMIVKFLILDKKHELTYLTAFYSLTVLLAVAHLC